MIGIRNNITIIAGIGHATTIITAQRHTNQQITFAPNRDTHMAIAPFRQMVRELLIDATQTCTGRAIPADIIVIGPAANIPRLTTLA
jgi:hypothetical protein